MFKKGFHKIAAAAFFSAIMVISCFTGLAGCKKDVDKTKTQLYVGVFDGGIGREWIIELARKFEEEHAETNFEPGVFVKGQEKKGVQVIIDYKKEQFTGDILRSSMAANRQDMYFTQEVHYESMVKDGHLADITDVVTEKYDTVDLGDGLKAYSLEDKMPEAIRRNLKSIDNKYHAVEWAQPQINLIYDVDLFCRKRLYFLENGTINGSIDNPNDHLLNGNGLPDTWPRFLELMKEMTDNAGVTPFTWSGMYAYQRTSFFVNMLANYHGYNDFVAYNSLNGTLRDGTVIDETNGYLQFETDSRRAAVQAAYDIASNKLNFSSVAFNLTQTHTYAQMEYLMSVLNNKPIAMLLEGSYWEAEAASVFSEMERKNPEYSMANRRFASMPLPRFIGVDGVRDQTSDEPVFYSNGDGLAFISAYSGKINLAKTFFKYFHTNKSMSRFQTLSGTPLNFNYVINDADYEKMSYFKKSVYDQFKAAGSKLITNRALEHMPNSKYIDKSFFVNAYSVVEVKGQNYIEPIQAFEQKMVTVDDWCASYAQKYSKAAWEAHMKSKGWPG